MHTLPVELLAHIFSLAADHTPVAFPPPLPAHSPIRALLACSHVCRYWRHTALAFAALWATLDTTSPRLAALALARARGAPLTVLLRDRVDDDKVTPTLEDAPLRAQLAAHCARIARLHVAPRFSYGPGLLAAFSRPTPLLRELTLEGTECVLPQLFAGRAPRLERLTLRGVAFWPGNDFTGLTHLGLYDQPPTARPTLAAFLDLLASCPRLEQLALVDAGPTLDDGPDTAAPRHITLPALRTLDIGHWPTAPAVARFLAHLTLPAHTALAIWTAPLRTLDLTALLPPDLHALAPLHRPTALHIASPPPTDGARVHAVCAARGTLHVLGALAPDQRAAGLVGPLDLRDLAALTLVRVGEGRAGCDPGWRDVLARAPRLRSITLAPYAPGVLSALLPVPGDADADSALVCPELQELAVTVLADAEACAVRCIMAGRVRATGRPARLVLAGEELTHTCKRDFCSPCKAPTARLEVVVQPTLDLRAVEPEAWPSEAYLWMAAEKRGE